MILIRIKKKNKAGLLPYTDAVWFSFHQFHIQTQNELNAHLEGLEKAIAQQGVMSHASFTN